MPSAFSWPMSVPSALRAPAPVNQGVRPLLRIMKAPASVFVSSTFVDLQAYRSAVVDALHRLEAVVKGMEYFGALPDTPKDECLRIVRSSRFYIGIFGMRYGSIDPESGKSLTQLEYEQAQKLCLPSLIYLLDEERQPVLPKHIDFGESADKLRAFKGALRGNHVVSFFTTPEDLALRVSQDLPALIERSGQEVNRSELARVTSSLPRIDWLTKARFEFLKQEAGEAITAIFPSDDLLKEAMEFLLSGDRLAAVFLLARGARIDLRDATDTLISLEGRIQAVIERGAKILSDRQQTSIEPNS